MHRRRGSTERGYRVADAELRKRDHVHVALDHHHAARRADRIARLHQPIDFAALLEERRLGRVQVFGLAVSDHAPAEADHGAARTEDREHHTLAEAILALALVLDDA